APLYSFTNGDVFHLNLLAELYGLLQGFLDVAPMDVAKVPVKNSERAFGPDRYYQIGGVVVRISIQHKVWKYPRELNLIAGRSFVFPQPRRRLLDWRVLYRIIPLCFSSITDVVYLAV